ncbi:hypothetical protein ATO13_22471 [Stappia sp. 22II-S9-Z10]|nr:hypothetical protein ATO13_22471 [Stappia sp. 22II-S9-Z10]
MEALGMLPNYAETAISVITMVANIAIAAAAVISAASYNSQMRSHIATTDRMSNIKEFQRITNSLLIFSRRSLEDIDVWLQNEAYEDEPRPWELTKAFREKDEVIERLHLIAGRIGDPAINIADDASRAFDSIRETLLECIHSREDRDLSWLEDFVSHRADGFVDDIFKARLKADELYREAFP